MKLNKPVNAGMTILDLSKHTMYAFYYNNLKPLYGNKVQLQMTDTDSVLFSCETNALFKDMYVNSHLFDTSDFPVDSLYREMFVRRKVLCLCVRVRVEECT